MTENEAAEIINDPCNITDELENYFEINTARKMAMDALHEIGQYKAIGTVEECRTAMEKQTAKIPRIMNTVTGKTDAVFFTQSKVQCPTCKKDRIFLGVIPEYCTVCGQKWEVEHEHKD